MQAVDLLHTNPAWLPILVIDFAALAAPAIITAAATADNTTTFFILYALFVLFWTFRKNLLAELSTDNITNNYRVKFQSVILACYVL